MNDFPEGFEEELLRLGNKKINLEKEIEELKEYLQQPNNVSEFFEVDPMSDSFGCRIDYWEPIESPTRREVEELTKPCVHAWTKYNGFTPKDDFQYCLKCDIRRKS